ncbi:MAG: DUF1761 domain-containing protein [Pyrinomonadaceae bacterium]|nr:DUF1761 domain-containing protein [Pyrinomonadaceae bacterium]
MNKPKINHLAVWVLVVVHQLIGALWYSPLLFANRWAALAQLTAADFESSSSLPYFISLVGALILIYVMAYIFKTLRVQSLPQGLLFGFLFWLGFLFTELLTYNAFELRPLGLALINGSKSLVTFLVTGATLGAWRKYISLPKPVNH